MTKAKKKTQRKKTPSRKKKAAKTKSAPAKKKSLKGRVLKWALIIGLGLFLCFPFLKATIAEVLIERKTGLDVGVGSLHFADGYQRVRVGNFRIHDDDDDEPILQVKEVEVEFTTALHRGFGSDPEIVRVRGADFHLNLGRERSRDNRQPPPRPPSNETEDEESPSWPRRIEIRESRILIRLGQGSRRIEVPIEDFRADFERSKGGDLVIDSAEGRLFGGRFRLRGDLRSLSDWRFDATLSNGDLRGLNKLAGWGISGQINGGLRLTSKDAYEGAGWVDIGQSDLWELPVLSDLASFMGLGLGTSDAFRRGRIEYFVEEGTLHLKALHLRGTPVSLWGRGRIPLNGQDAEIDLIPRFAEGFTGDLPVIGAPTQLLLDAVSGTTTQIRLRGSLSKPQLFAEPLPFLGDTWRGIEGLFDGR